MATPRNLIVAIKNAQVQILERHQSLKEHDVVTNSVTEKFMPINTLRLLQNSK